MTRRTKRRYAHELYPEGEEGVTRALAVEVPYLYARTLGLDVWGTSWHDLGQPREDGSRDQGELIAIHNRISAMVETGRLALLADALLQGLSGQAAWEWADRRAAGDTIAEWAWERARHYGVPCERIKPYPCGPEPASHDHMASSGDVMGHGIITRVDCPESECPACTEDVDQ